MKSILPAILFLGCLNVFGQQNASIQDTLVQNNSSKNERPALPKAVSEIVKTGKIRIGNIDLDPVTPFGINKYEGLRLGIAAKLNDNFNKYISPDAYVAYGFRDKAWKYGAGIDLRTNLEKKSFFRAEYFHDVDAAGRIDDNLWSLRMKILNSGINSKNGNFYKFDGFRIGYQTQIAKDISVGLSAKRQSEEAGFGYTYKNIGGKFKNFSTSLMLKYAPQNADYQENMLGKNFVQSFPEALFTIEQGFEGLGGNFSYTRADALISQRLKTSAGTTKLRAWGGISTADAPIWHQFEMSGLSPGNVKGLFSHLYLVSYLGFATMPAGRYYSDKFVGFYAEQELPFKFTTFGNAESSFSLLYRGTIGDMKHPEYHGFQFEKMNHLYHETGLQWNNFLSLPVDVGAFYRVGYYKTDKFKENFGLQFKLNALGF